MWAIARASDTPRLGNRGQLRKKPRLITAVNQRPQTLSCQTLQRSPAEITRVQEKRDTAVSLDRRPRHTNRLSSFAGSAKQKRLAEADRNPKSGLGRGNEQPGRQSEVQRNPLLIRRMEGRCRAVVKKNHTGKRQGHHS